MGGRDRLPPGLLKSPNQTRACAGLFVRAGGSAGDRADASERRVGSDVHYERLEFLGDAVLDLAIADLLMRKFPTAKEGPLSKQRASIVNARTLALKAQAIELNEMIRLGKGEEKSGGREKTSILAAAFEAVIGAIYTDGGLTPAQQVVERLFTGDIGGPAAGARLQNRIAGNRVPAFSHAAGVRTDRDGRARSCQALYDPNQNRGPRSRRGRGR